MRVLVAIALILFSSSPVFGQVCAGCACKGGSGWLLTRTQKCIGCPEVLSRCTLHDCIFVGCKLLDRIGCLEFIPRDACGFRK